MLTGPAAQDLNRSCVQATVPTDNPNHPNHVSDFLIIKGVSKAFDNFVALHDIDLAVRQGELVCFLGPSGCGKTTLLRIIAGLEVQSAGQIMQDGRDISLLPPIKRDYGIVFQSYALFPNLSVFDNVAYGLVNEGRAGIEKRVGELLTLVGLPDSVRKYPSQLSGGQQQRIALARALATSPGLLLLDEPLSALDALERVRLRTEIRELQKRLGVTTIMVTHDQEEALSMADRIVVMNQGVIEQIGTPEEIYRLPSSPFVADFVGKINILRGTARGNGEFSVGSLKLSCPNCANGVAPGSDVKVYLRPEDVMARDIIEGSPNSAMGTIGKIEFLGAFSLVRITLDGLLDQPLTVYFSLNYMNELGLAEGARLRFGLLGDRMRVFGSGLEQAQHGGATHA